MVQRIKDFIFKDVQNENETKKVAVTLRISALILVVYFISLFLVFCSIGYMISAGISIICGGCYLMAFYTTYLNRTRFASIFSEVLMVIWILIFILRFGWDCGVQHFVFALLVLNFTVNAETIRQKLCGAAAACGYRFFLYAYTLSHAPMVELSQNIRILFQVINTITIFAQMTVILIIFTQDSQEMENKLVRYNEKLERIASIDPLTGLCNRWSMRTYLENTTKEYFAGNIDFISVAIGDIDFFKRINDTYGHDAGDLVLQELAKIFLRELEKEGKVCRWGGEEFLFVFQNRNGDQANKMLNDMMQKIRMMEVPYQGEKIRLTMTFGLVEYGKEDDMDAVIKEADDKLYRGKENGRNQIVY